MPGESWDIVKEEKDKDMVSPSSKIRTDPLVQSLTMVGILFLSFTSSSSLTMALLRSRI
jgi:hypothetical protein